MLQAVDKGLDDDTLKRFKRVKEVYELFRRGIHASIVWIIVKSYFNNH